MLIRLLRTYLVFVSTLSRRKQKKAEESRKRERIAISLARGEKEKKRKKDKTKQQIIMSSCLKTSLLVVTVTFDATSFGLGTWTVGTKRIKINFSPLVI